jgi:hypothetical protein
MEKHFGYVYITFISKMMVYFKIELSFLRCFAGLDLLHYTSSTASCTDIFYLVEMESPSFIHKA